MRRWSVVTAVAVGGVMLVGLGVGRAGAETKRLLGTVRVTGPVESALPGETLRPLTGGAVVEGMRIRTGAGGLAVIQLTDGDVLGLAESSTLELPGAGRARPRLVDGRLALRLRAESGLSVDVAAASVRPPAVKTVATTQREALVALNDGTVLVRPYRGTFEVAGPSDGTVTQVAAGQQATIAPQAAAPTVVAASGTNGLSPDLKTGAGAGAGGGFLAGLGISNGLATAIGTSVAVVGGGLGGAAASGALSGGGGSSDSGGGGAQGSPFRP